LAGAHQEAAADLAVASAAADFLAVVQAVDGKIFLKIPDKKRALIAQDSFPLKN
jgi:hypothetical protein